MRAKTVRLMFFRLLDAGMSARQAPEALWDVLVLAGIMPRTEDKTKFSRHWPTPFTVKRMNVERGIIAEIAAGEKLLSCDDRSVTGAGDAATKMDRERFAFGFFHNKDGPGSKILFEALGIVELLGGAATDEKNGIDTILARIVIVLNLAREQEGKPPITVNDLWRKFGLTMSDSVCAWVLASVYTSTGFCGRLKP